MVAPIIRTSIGGNGDCENDVYDVSTVQAGRFSITKLLLFVVKGKCTLEAGTTRGLLKNSDLGCRTFTDLPPPAIFSMTED
jgi:hypothetical protein